MGWLSGLVIAALGFATAPARAACVVEPFNLEFSPGPIVESTPPSELTLGAVSVLRSPAPGEECPQTTQIRVAVSASDDTTPSDQLGIRVQIGESSGDQIPNPTGSGIGLLIVRFRDPDVDLDFDLRLSAIDRSGNVGPESVIPIFDEAPGCHAGKSAGWLFPLFAVLGLIRRRRVMAGFTVVVLGLVTHARPADACSRIGDTPFEPGDPLETTAPSPVTIGAVSVSRYSPEDEAGACGSVATTCSAITTISIDVAATDDSTPANQVAYALRIVEGTAPPFDELYDRLRSASGSINLSASGADDDFDFVLGIAAIDSSGNVGQETTIRIASDASGCNVGGGTSWSFLWVAAALALAMRRRR
jgi:hypothetical protein